MSKTLPLAHMTHRDTVALRADLDAAITQIVGSGAPYLSGYPIEAVNNELAMALYRRAIALGLHATGVEALLLRSLQAAEDEIKTRYSVTDDDGEAALAMMTSLQAAGMVPR